LIRENVLLPLVTATVVVLTTTPAWFVTDIVAVVTEVEEKVASNAGLPAVVTLIPSKFEAVAVAKMNIATIEVIKVFILLVFKVCFF
jgi:hypothetical protein